MIRRVFRLLELMAADPRTIVPLVTWPKFSIASYRIVSRLKGAGVEPRTVLDVGANVGQFAVAASKLFDNVEVHSFEPLSAVATVLKKNVASLADVRVYPMALGEQDGNITIHVSRDTQSSSVKARAEGHIEAFPDEVEVGTERVRLSRLDTVFNGVDLPRPVLLKLDVQGYEAETLRGAEQVLKRVNHVVVETSFQPMYQNEMVFLEILGLMRDQGFEFVRPVGWLEVPGTRQIVQMDALFQRVDELSEERAVSG